MKMIEIIVKDRIRWIEVIDSLRGDSTYRIDIRKTINDDWMTIGVGNIYATQDLYKLLINRFGYDKS